jgi:hypothetical protein
MVPGHRRAHTWIDADEKDADPGTNAVAETRKRFHVTSPFIM